jgi:cell wall assembly regulator SMI1
MCPLWNRIETWLEENAPDVRGSLLPGATEKAIRAAEKAMGIDFPEDVKESYRVHNGQHELGAPLMGEWQLLSLKDMVRQWKVMKKLVASGAFAENRGRPVGPVRPDWYNLKWIPVAYNGAGDFHCVDLDPPPRGKAGQIVSFWHVDDKRERLATSFRAWVKEFADDLERGNYTVEDGQLKFSPRKRG